MTNLDNELNHFKSGISDKDLHGLEFVFDILEKAESENEISDEQLKTFEAQIGSLLDDVKSSDLEPDFKRFVLNNLILIQNAIKNYRFFGSSGLHGAMARVVGEIILDPRQAAESPKKKQTMQKVITVLKGINAAIVFVRNGIEIVRSLPIAKQMGLE